MRDETNPAPTPATTPVQLPDVLKAWPIEPYGQPEFPRRAPTSAMEWKPEPWDAD